MHNFAIILPLLVLLIIFFLYGSRLKIFYNYRKAHLWELDKLKELGQISYQQYKKTLDPKNYQLLKDNLENDNMWQNLMGCSAAFICENNNSIIGMAFLVPSGNPTDIYPADTSYIRMVGVHPDHSGKGIAKKLTGMCIDEARQTGESTLMLHTSEFMPAARHIYEDFGFTVDREIPQRFGKRYWLYKLKL